MKDRKANLGVEAQRAQAVSTVQTAELRRLFPLLDREIGGQGRDGPLVLYLS